MKTNRFLSEKQHTDISLVEFQKYAQGWLLACEISCASSTLGNRRIYVRNLIWFLKREEYSSCGVTELRAFFAYFNYAHKDPGGRWNNPREKNPVRQSTIATYHRHITALFHWIVDEGAITESPMARVVIKADRDDHIEPFTLEQVSALLAAARKSRYPRRDEAILSFLLDTGCRSSELCNLTFTDIDMSAKKAIIREGKGGKSRTVYFGRTTSKALWNYLKTDGREENEPLFLSERGDPFTRSGLGQMLERLGLEAGLRGVRCSPHTCRHTASVNFLRNGGNQFSLMNLLGHVDLKMTARYVKLADADVERQHRNYGLMDSLKGGGKK